MIILCSRRRIQNEEAGRATAVATMIRDAKNTLSATLLSVARQVVRTDITPDWRAVDSIGTPYNSVHTIVKACKRAPNHVKTRPHVPRFKVPWQRHQDEHRREQSDGWVGRKVVDHVCLVVGVRSRRGLREQGTFLSETIFADSAQRPLCNEREPLRPEKPIIGALSWRNAYVSCCICFRRLARDADGLQLFSCGTSRTCESEYRAPYYSLSRE